MSTLTEYRILPSGFDLIRVSNHLDGDVDDTYLLGGKRITKVEYDALYPLAKLKENQTKFYTCRECSTPCILVVPEDSDILPTACPYKGAEPKWKAGADE